MEAIQQGGEIVKFSAEQIELYERMTELQQQYALNRLAGMNIGDSYVATTASKAVTTTAGSTAASVLEAHLNVKSFLRSFIGFNISSAVLSRDEILLQLTDIANGTVYDVMDFQEDEDTGQSILRIKNINELTPRQRILIKKIKQGKYGLELELHSSMEARKMINEMMGYNAPTEHKVLSEDNQVDLTEEQTLDKLKEIGLSREANQLEQKRVSIQ